MRNNVRILGVIKGTKYFDCPAGRGLMVRPEDVKLL